jgi:hypothetical protein
MRWVAPAQQSCFARLQKLSICFGDQDDLHNKLPCTLTGLRPEPTAPNLLPAPAVTSQRSQRYPVADPLLNTDTNSPPWGLVVFWYIFDRYLQLQISRMPSRVCQPPLTC